MRRGLRRCVALLLAVLVSACSSSAARRATPTTAATTAATPVTTTPAPVTTAAPVVTARVAARVPGFAHTVSTVSAADLPSSYRAGCPVGPAQLRALHLSYWGFDEQPHAGTLVVNAAVVDAVIAVFGRLYDDRFPIRQMRPVDAFGGSDPASMAADNTSAFNCRDAVASGPPRWSAHAYGEAIDVNTVENPYVQGTDVQPAAGSAFLDRATHRPGMAYSGGALVSAFASVGWPWGGRWSDPDYQHFSATGG